jgi:hypothetical protein
MKEAARAPRPALFSTGWEACVDRAAVLWIRSAFWNPPIENPQRMDDCARATKGLPMKRQIGWGIFILMICMGPALAAAEIYQWIDEQGVLHFTDGPPPPGAWKAFRKSRPMNRAPTRRPVQMSMRPPGGVRIPTPPRLRRPPAPRPSNRDPPAARNTGGVADGRANRPRTGKPVLPCRGKTPPRAVRRAALPGAEKIDRPTRMSAGPHRGVTGCPKAVVDESRFEPQAQRNPSLHLLKKSGAFV